MGPIAQLMPQPQAPVSLQTYAQQQAQAAALEREKAGTAQTQTQTTGLAQENEMRARDLADQAALSKMFSAPDFNPDELRDPSKFLNAQRAAGVSMGTALKNVNASMATRQSFASMQKAEFENLQEQHKQEQGQLEAMEAAPPEQREGMFQALKASHPDLAQFQSYPGSDKILPYINTLKLGGSLLAERGKQGEIDLKAAEKEQNLAKADSERSAADKNRAEIPGIKTKADVGKLQFNSQKLAAAFEQGDTAFQAALGKLPYEEAKPFEGAKSKAAVLALGVTPDQAITTGETNRHNKVEEGLSGGRLNVERDREAREQNIYRQTYGEGSNEALRGVEPKLRLPATKEAQKAGDEYNKALTASEDMQTFLDLARTGNKAAGSNLPLVGVSTINALNGIKRINQAEIAQYEGAGSLLDRIQGKIGKLAVGQPIPKDVLNDIESLHKTLTTNATTTYHRKLDGINQNFRSNFKPVTGQKPATPAPAMIRARDDKGNLHEAPAGTALPAGWKLEGQ